MDIEDLIARVWNPDVRDLVDEAWRCYGIGAMRACITTTWVAVCVDLMEKISRLADDGDALAGNIRKDIEQAQQDGLTPAGVGRVQTVERDLISNAAKLELVDAIAARDLGRLREDRHLCAHPSLRGIGDPYVPRAEAARAHLANALNSLLSHPPTQGGAVVDRFATYVTASTFTASPTYLVTTFIDRARPAARRRILDLAAKHAMLELAVESANAEDVADNMAACLTVFATRHREEVAGALSKSMDRLLNTTHEQILRAFTRLGDLEVFWSLVDAPLIDHFKAALTNCRNADGSYTQDVIRALSLAGVSEVSALIPELLTTFRSADYRVRAGASSRRTSPFFAAEVPSILRDAGSWRGAEEATRQGVLPQATELTGELLAAGLEAWADNYECRTAGGMLDLAVALYEATGHLHPGDAPIWWSFLDKVREKEPYPSPYRYVELERRLPERP